MSVVWELKKGRVQWYYWLFGIISTLALILLNSIEVAPDQSSMDPEQRRSIRNRFFTFFVFAFMGLAGPGWIMIIMEVEEEAAMYPTIALFLQNFLIFCSMMLLRFTGRVDTSDYMSTIN
jgi:hypothetical protein